jgi:hypothetical protein
MPKTKAIKRDEALSRIERKIYESADFLAQGSNARYARGFTALDDYIDEANKIRRAIGIPMLYLDMAAFTVSAKVIIIMCGYQDTINQEIWYAPDELNI